MSRKKVGLALGSGAARGLAHIGVLEVLIPFQRKMACAFMGCIGARLRLHPHQADIGYWLGVPYWNRGYMTEAIRLICHFCFKHLDAIRTYATVFVGNVGSRRALEKNGFSLDGTLRQHLSKRDEWLDAWFLTLLRSEWDNRREIFCPRYEEVVVARNKE